LTNVDVDETRQLEDIAGEFMDQHNVQLPVRAKANEAWLTIIRRGDEKCEKRSA
jgi:hypothetical protein